MWTGTHTSSIGRPVHGPCKLVDVFSELQPTIGTTSDGGSYNEILILTLAAPT
jgi:hypothetical protein